MVNHSIIASGAVIACIVVGVIAPPSTATASVDKDKCVNGVCGTTGGDGAAVGLTRDQTSRLPKKGESEVKKGNKTIRKMVPYEYSYVHACPNNSPTGADAGCQKSFTACISVKDATGPLVDIYRRVSEPKGKPWGSAIAQTCWPKLIPNAKHKPEITVAMIRAAFVKTPFVKPKATMEPVGNKTLVNLPNYFTADFSGAGYGPDEVRTVTLLGHKVHIKPVLKSNTFHFGDGSSMGPTTSRGGGYPDGDVKHTYSKRGTVSASVTTVYGGQFAIDGGKFTDLPGTATITGPAQPIQVLEATGRLVR